MPARKLQSGRYQARHWDAEKATYVSLGTFATEADAHKAEAKANLLQEMGLVPDTAPAKSTTARGRERFTSYAERKLRLKRHKIKRSTYHGYNFTLMAHLVPRFGNMAVADIHSHHVEEWWTSMEENPHGRKAAYALLRQFLGKAVKEGLISRNPCQIDGAGADPSAKRPTFSTGDFRMLEMMTSDAQMRASLWVLVGTGARTGEMLALDWQDIDFEQGTIAVSKHFGPYGMEGGTKSHDDGARLLAMPTEGMEALRRLYQDRTPLPGDPVFVNARNERLSYHSFNKRFVALKLSCGLDDMHAHDLRHVHLSEFAKVATMAEVMARAGHTDHRSALRYQHADPQRQRELVSQLAF